ncbi:MAG: EpsG family protein [Tissierellia bacterium]|nr:EpsG family protein [Tissierellia bacterium]
MLIAFSSSLIKFENRIQKAFVAIFMFLIMLFFAAMRGTGEGDYFNYLHFAQVIKYWYQVTNPHFPVEIGFRFIAFVINSLDLSRQWVIAIMNILSIVPVIYITGKKSYNPIVSALVFLPFLLQFDMQTSRTATAMGMGLMAFYFNSQRKFFKTILFTILAISFHKSALIIIPMLFIAYIEFSRIFKIISIMFAFVISLRARMFIDLFIKIIQSVGLSSVAAKIQRYTYGEDFAFAMKIIDPRILFALFLFITSLMYFENKDFKKASLEDVSIKAMWISLGLLLVFRQSTAVSFRLSSFYGLLEIIYIPLVIEKIKRFDPLGSFFIKASIGVYIIPYAIFLAMKAPAYDFFFSNPQAFILL